MSSEGFLIKIYRFFESYRLVMISNLKKAFFSLNPMVKIGSSFYVEKNARIRTVAHWGCGKVSLGKNCFLGEGAMLVAQGGDIIIGDNTSINQYTVIYGMGGAKIGNNVRIGPRCSIIPQNHNYKRRETTIISQGMTSAGVVIEDDVWLGAGVIVVDGVHIRQGSVIGAGAVVTKNTEPYSINVGVPVKKIGERI